MTKVGTVALPEHLPCGCLAVYSRTLCRWLPVSEPGLPLSHGLAPRILGIWWTVLCAAQHGLGQRTSWGAC